MDLAASLMDGIALHRDGRMGEAEARYREVLAAVPNFAPAAFVLGLLLLGSERAAEAVPLLRRACELRPGHAGQVLGLARALLAVEQPDAVDAVLALLPEAAALPVASRAEASFLRGCALNAARPGKPGQPDAAARWFQAALADNPLHAAAHANLGNALADLDRAEDAEASLRRALALDAALPEALASLGHVLGERGELVEAINCCDRAIALKPDLAAAHWNKGIACLLGGRMEEGWALYEWRKRRFPAGFVTLPGPAWQGEALDGRRILVLAEQGFGDAIQFARFLPMLAARGAEVWLRCDRRLHPLLEGMTGFGARGLGLLAPDAALPAYDVWVDQMSLPGLFGTRLDSVPSAGAYLAADPELVSAWRRRLPAGRRVGVVWAGNPEHSNDRRRSLPAAALLELARAAADRLVSLQVGQRAGELAAWGVPELGGYLSSFAETAAVLTALDEVWTVDTAVAHLAGALGVPCLVMLPHAPDWRWMRDREDTPWYPAMRLVRQDGPGNWSGVIRRVTARLLVAAAA